MMNMSDRGIETMAIIVAIHGSKRAGTALMSMNQQFLAAGQCGRGTRRIRTPRHFTSW